MITCPSCKTQFEPKRTIQQNNSIHLFCSQLAEKLNEMGLGMRELLKPTYYIEWSTTSVKEHLWRPFQIALTGKHSTTELTKNEGEIDKIHKTLMRELGERKQVPFIEFPHKCPRCHNIDCICEHEN